jgi:hypothetical protein
MGDPDHPGRIGIIGPIYKYYTDGITSLTSPKSILMICLIIAVSIGFVIMMVVCVVWGIKYQSRQNHA